MQLPLKLKGAELLPSIQFKISLILIHTSNAPFHTQDLSPSKDANHKGMYVWEGGGGRKNRTLPSLATFHS